MDGVVVDTDVLIDYFSGVSPQAEAIERLLREARLVVTALTLFELACGAQTEEQLYDIELLAQAAHLVELDGPSALRAGAVYRELKEKGQMLGTADLLIAGCCLAGGLPLLTRNTEHFSRVSGLELLKAEEI
jgi:predicted nucleic acid-binding protein